MVGVASLSTYPFFLQFSHLLTTIIINALNLTCIKLKDEFQNSKRDHSTHLHSVQ